MVPSLQSSEDRANTCQSLRTMLGTQYMFKKLLFKIFFVFRKRQIIVILSLLSVFLTSIFEKPEALRSSFSAFRISVIPES